MTGYVRPRVIDTAGAETNELLAREPSEVSWLTVNAETLNTQGLIQIYDGFDAGGVLVWQLEPGYSRHHNFLPPIHCLQGVFVHADAAIASYTIAVNPCEQRPFKE